MPEYLNILDLQDTIALLFFLAGWMGYSYYTKHQTRRQSLLAATNHYRLMWMRQMLKRDNRSVDAIMVGNLMRSITFSANTTIFILAGLIGMLSYQSRVGEVISAIPFLIFIYAYFKYTWSLRQHNYTSILIAAAPLDTELEPTHDAFAKKAAFLAGNAADHFNSGLRAYYFGLAALGWFVHPVLFMLATAMVIFVIQKREFHSRTLQRLKPDA